MTDGDEPVEGADGGPKARTGRVNLTLRIHPEVHRQLRLKALHADTSIQDIIMDALRRIGIES